MTIINTITGTTDTLKCLPYIKSNNGIVGGNINHNTTRDIKVHISDMQRRIIILSIVLIILLIIVLISVIVNIVTNASNINKVKDISE